MRRVFKYTAIVILVLAALLAGFLLTFDINRYKDDIVQAVESRTGRQVTIKGDIGLGLSLVPTVVIENASLGNAAWGSRPAMLTIKRFEAGVALLPLLGGNIRISNFVLDGPELFLETDKRGRGNWLLGKGGKPQAQAEPAGTKTATPPSLSIRHLLVEDARITYRDGRTGETRSLHVPRLSLETGSGSAPVQLELAAEYEKKLLTLDGRIGSLETLLQNEPYRVDLQGRMNGLKLALKGDLEQPLKARGLALDVTASADSLAALRDGNGTTAGPIAVSASLTDAKPDVYQLKPFKITLAESSLVGQARLDLNGKRPALSADLDSKRLDLRPFQPEEKEKKEEPMFSKEPLPVAALRSLDADVNLRADEILTRSLPLQNVKLGLKLQNGRLRLQPLSATAAGGALGGGVQLIAAGDKTLKLDMDVRIKGLQPARLPKLKDKVKGAATDVSLIGAGSGGSVSAIMGSLNGGLLLQAGKGQFEKSALNVAGADVLTQTLSLLRPDSDQPAMTELQCAVVAFRIKDGVAASDKGIALETPQMTVVGGGTVNLGTEKLDLGLQPHPREGIGISAGQFAELVRLGGTLSNPRPKTDTLGAVKTAARVGAAVATGGISLLAGGIFERATADDHPCDTALAFAAGKSPAQETAKPAASGGDSGSAEKQESGDNLGDKVKGVFKGLFGD